MNYSMLRFTLLVMLLKECLFNYQVLRECGVTKSVECYKFLMRKRNYSALPPHTTFFTIGATFLAEYNTKL
jgi:hypothetical protein